MPVTRPNGVANGELGNLNEDLWKLKISDNDQKGGGDDDQQNQLPDRPGEPNCNFYMKTGTCGFGGMCKYNHPTTFSGQGTVYRDELPQRDGQPDCQFFLKTGFCKFASSCRYNHPRDKHDGQSSLLNSLGLPLRKDEKPCPHFMRTTSCKFGLACKFNHPEPTTISAMALATEASAYSPPPAAPPETGGPFPWVLSRDHHRVQGPSYMPVVLPPNAVQHGWSPYMSNVGIPILDAFGSTQMPNSTYHVHPGSSTPVVWPEKPDQPECQYYLRTGKCKYGTSCKYNHPQETNQAAACTIGPVGLPLRPGFPVCISYTRYGSCQYGSGCKYDHPAMGYYSYPPVFAIQELPVLVNPSGLILSLAENYSSKSTKAADKLVKSDRIVELHDTDSSENDDPSSRTSSSHRTPQLESPKNQSD